MIEDITKASAISNRLWFRKIIKVKKESILKNPNETKLLNLFSAFNLDIAFCLKIPESVARERIKKTG